MNRSRPMRLIGEPENSARKPASSSVNSSAKRGAAKSAQSEAAKAKGEVGSGQHGSGADGLADSQHPAQEPVQQDGMRLTRAVAPGVFQPRVRGESGLLEIRHVGRM